MQAQFPVRKWRAAAALIALLAGPILGMILNAAPAQAVPSADPSKEIVYVDRNGIIRVLDTQGDPLVQWFSPTGGWREIDLGDVNDDGDLEIIAIGSEGGNTKIGVFDPVIASGITDPNKKINGIPWDTLYEETFVGSPGIVVAGNFDNAIPGDEFAFSYQDTSGVTRGHRHERSQPRPEWQTHRSRLETARRIHRPSFWPRMAFRRQRQHQRRRLR